MYINSKCFYSFNIFYDTACHALILSFQIKPELIRFSLTGRRIGGRTGAERWGDGSFGYFGSSMGGRWIRSSMTGPPKERRVQFSESQYVRESPLLLLQSGSTKSSAGLLDLLYGNVQNIKKISNRFEASNSSTFYEQFFLYERILKSFYVLTVWVYFFGKRKHKVCS